MFSKRASPRFTCRHTEVKKLNKQSMQVNMRNDIRIWKNMHTYTSKQTGGAHTSIVLLCNQSLFDPAREQIYAHIDTYQLCNFHKQAASGETWCS